MVSSSFIRKNKMVLAKEVASIRPLELFGLEACDVSWEYLFRKHLAFDVLKCGSLSCDGENCIKDVIGSNCNC